MGQTDQRFLPLLVLESSQQTNYQIQVNHGFKLQQTRLIVDPVQRQRNMVGIRTITRNQRNAGVGKRGGARKRKVGRQNRGFGNESCSHENDSFSLSSAAELRQSQYTNLAYQPSLYDLQTLPPKESKSFLYQPQAPVSGFFFISIPFPHSLYPSNKLSLPLVGRRQGFLRELLKVCISPTYCVCQTVPPAELRYELID